MSSWLSDIANYVKGAESVTRYCGDRVFVGNDINLIDTAYSDTGDYKASIFFVPGDVTVGDSVGAIQYNVRRFYAYVFVPTENDLDCIPAWEFVTGTLGSDIESFVCVSGHNCKFVSSRVYRQGRGYYIYVYEFSSLSKSNNDLMVEGYMSLFRYTGEIDGEAQYVFHRNILCVFDKSRGTNISVGGIDNNFVYTFYIEYDNELFFGMNQKSFVITGTFNRQPFASKAEAKDAGFDVYEVVSWKSIPVGANDNVLMELTCVCNV